MNWILKLLINTIAVVITAYILPGVQVDNITSALIVAFVLAVLNALVKPLLIIITLPITILTLGLFLLVINAVIILLADDLVSGFSVNSFWWALLFSFVMSFLNSLFKAEDKKNKNEE
jgi:putative membrane protein